jgi:hypothetical protein
MAIPMMPRTKLSKVRQTFIAAGDNIPIIAPIT